MNNDYIKNIKRLINKCGKEFIKELIDLMIINKKIDNNYLRSLLIKNNVIKKSTKFIRNIIYSYEETHYINGKYTNTGDIIHELHIYNGRNQMILFVNLKQSMIPEVFDILNTCS